MNEEKKPSDRARESLGRGFGEVFKAASSVADAVKREVKRNAAPNLGIGGLGKALDDASREIVRAASSVATAVGTELETWGKKAQEALDEEAVRAPQKSAPPPAPAAASGHASESDDWPKTREEYEKKYGRDGDDWPRSRQEYIDKYGRPPRPKDDDPGFRIATDGVDLGGGPKR
ncbi:MAG TPA: hypothetical protein VL400_07265 [Polyangiaceae bacterium]|jgi:hypothetical protein|nr:hypothetical protein [Polyangiaceae bacterium]